MNSYLESQTWRYATKKYNPQKKVSENDIDFLLEAIRLTPSSYGLQPYKVYIIEDENLRQKLEEAAYGQKQITESSHLFVFANVLNIDEAKVDQYITNVVETRPSEMKERLLGYGEFIKRTINLMSEEEKNVWTAKQTYLAAGNLLNAAAMLKIDSTPFEGFDSLKYNQILGFNSKMLSSCLVITVGYRHEEDPTQFFKKVRKSKSDLFERL